jgi:hypothetical protein
MPADSPQRRTIRSSWASSLRVALLWLVPLSVGFALLGAFSSRSMAVWLVPALAAFFVLNLVGERRRGISLTPTEAVIHGPWSSRRVPWARVVGVSTEQSLKLDQIVLRLDDGTRTALWVPASGLGVRPEDVHRTYEQVDRWWRAHRGRGAGPAHPAE